jgi:hypothetical protein
MEYTPSPLGGRCLVMAGVRLRLADILLGFFVEGLLASSRAK